MKLFSFTGIPLLEIKSNAIFFPRVLNLRWRDVRPIRLAMACGKETEQKDVFPARSGFNRRTPLNRHRTATEPPDRSSVCASALMYCLSEWRGALCRSWEVFIRSCVFQEARRRRQKVNCEARSLFLRPLSWYSHDLGTLCIMCNKALHRRPWQY